ncbi:MAG: hydrolase, carbon-nitrogen family protein [Thermomicrobiales bacterium]|jgi:deaminated glutathione amidase|nr:hydrolase, carbon-nitrogen family protein [Thermomicrobiales bacterium]
MTAHDNGRVNTSGVAGLNVAIVQMNSQEDKGANIAAALDLIDRAAATGARLVALPEVWPYLGPDDVSRDQAETIPGPISEALAQRARRHGIYIHGGSIYEKRPGDPGMYNTTVVIDPTGEIIAHYSKIHMYDVVLDGIAEYQESATVTPGNETTITEIDGIPVGLTICYDLRFPELFRILALKGAQAIVLPAAFTLMTGKDHWETLIRARAIENELYVIAPAQWGTHRPGKWCYGRSMVVDPWGTVVTTAPDGVGIAYATVDPSRVASVRRQIPSLANRRPEAYRWPEESRSLVTGRLAF